MAASKPSQNIAQRRTLAASRRLVALLLALASLSAETVRAEPVAVAKSFRSGPWLVVDSANFRVCAIADETTVQKLTADCEALRSTLASQWLSSDASQTWQPKCHVVLHPTAASYLRDVGEAQTAGSSLIEFQRNQLVTRRVDLRADHPDGFSDALAHELTHVVVAERFVDRQIPRWADEGMAVLADSPSKQDLHARDLYLAHRQGGTFRVVELLDMVNYPAATKQATFYGQSASLVKFLVDRGGHAQFLKFVEQSAQQGYDRALAEVYAIAGLRELEQQWTRHVGDSEARFVQETAKKSQLRLSVKSPKKAVVQPVSYPVPARAVEKAMHSGR